MVMVFWSGSFVQSSQAVETEEKMDIVEQLINCPDGGELHLKFIEQMKHDPDSGHRSTAAINLGVVKSKSEITQEAFLWMLDNEKDDMVLDEVISGIQKNSSTLGPLEKVFKARLDKEIQIWEEIKNNTRRNHNDSFRRNSIAFLIGSIGSCGPEAFEVLEKYENHRVIKETYSLSNVLLFSMAACGSEKSFKYLKSHLKDGDLTEMPQILGSVKCNSKEESDEVFQSLLSCATSKDRNKREASIGSLEAFYRAGKIEALDYLEELAKDPYNETVIRQSMGRDGKITTETVCLYPVRDRALLSLRILKQQQQ